MKYREALLHGAELLEKAGIEEAELDARLLLEWCCGTDRQTLLLTPDRGLSEEESASYEAGLSKRKERIPLQQVTGVQCFMGLDFAVTPDVLIPRADTEILVEEVMKDGYAGERILDLCTGSGCILISLLHYGTSVSGIGCDISERALHVARKNAAAILAGKDSDTDRSVFSFRQGDLYEALAGTGKERFDIIVSNPPYIASEVIPTLAPEVKDHDPVLALDGGADGLDFYRRIIADAPSHLTREGRIYLEIGYDQAETVSRLLADAGFSDTRVIRDYAGHDRVVAAVLR